MATATHIPPEPAHPGSSHETSDASARGVVVFVVVMLGIIAILSVYIWHQFHGYRAANERMDGDPSPFVDTRPPPPEPRLQPEYQSHDTLPYQDMELLKATWASELLTYGRLPGRPDAARIPIERAMDLFAERGLPPATSKPTTRPEPIGGKP